MSQQDYYRLPDGREIYIPPDASRSQLDSLFAQIAQAYPTEYGQYYNDYSSSEPEGDGNLFGAAVEGLKGIPKGYYGTVLSGLGGLAGVLTPTKDTAVERKIRRTQDFLQQLGQNEKYADSYLAKLGQGLGSGLAYWAGIGALQPLKMGQYLPASARALSPKAGSAAADFATRMGVSGQGAAATGRFVKGTLDQAALIAPFSVPIQWGQHAAQVADYEERTGEDVSAVKELLGYGMTVPLALTEAIGIGALGGAAGGIFGKSEIARGLKHGANIASKGTPWHKAAIAGATEEALQESIQTIGAAGVAQALYDDEAYANLGQELFDAATVGGGAGGVMAVLLNMATRRVGGNALGLDLQAARKIKERDLRRRGRTEDGRPGTPESMQITSGAGFGLANPNLTEDEKQEQFTKRTEYHADQIKIEQQINAQKDSNYEVLTPEQLQAEAQLRVERDFLRDQQLYEESTRRDAEVRSEAGATFAELDNIGGMPLEELVLRVTEGELTLQQLDEILVSDRLSRAGAGKRNELREFVIRNSSAHNRYDTGAVAAAVMGGDPSLTEGAETSEDMFGTGSAEDQWLRARQLLAPYLPTELADALIGTTGFTTARGSTYEVQPDGTTIRQRISQTPDGPRFDPQGESQKTFYIRPEDVSALSPLQMILPPDVAYILAEHPSRPGEVGLGVASGPNAGQFLEDSFVPYTTTPEVGLIPVESWVGQDQSFDELAKAALARKLSDGSGNQAHFGNEITAVNAVAPKQYLNPSEVNQLIETAANNIKNFNKETAYSSIYGLDAGVDLYDRVHRTDQPKAATWRERDGQLELNLIDEPEPVVVDKIKKDMSDEGKGKPLWEDPPRYRETIKDLLSVKNIRLHKRLPKDLRSKEGFKSDAFKALVRSVTGQEAGDINKLNASQSKRLYGHLHNMPTFDNETLLPDLSVRMYGPEQLSNVVTKLAAVKDGATPTQRSLTRKELGADLVDGRNFTSSDLDQLLLHLQEGGYVERKGQRFTLLENNRAHARSQADVTREQVTEEVSERQRIEEERLAQSEKTKATLLQFINNAKAAVTGFMTKRGLNESGIDAQLSADFDSIYDVIFGEAGIIQNPEAMGENASLLDGPNARILLNLSAIDPGSDTAIEELIEQLDNQVLQSFEDFGYYFQDEIEAMDAQARDKMVPETMWQRYLPDTSYQETTFEQFAPQINPSAPRETARALFMEALAKGEIDKSKTAGRVGNLKKTIDGYLRNSIEAAQASPLKDVLTIFNAVQTGAVGRRGPGQSLLQPEGGVRNLAITQYVDPRHYKALKQAIQDEDVEAQERILDTIFQEEQADIREADPPTTTWDQKLFNRMMYEQELKDTPPGEVPHVGKNASEDALDSYYRSKRGEQPYVMPEAVKQKFRRKVNWTPTPELSDLVEKYGHPDMTEDERLSGEVYLENSLEMDGDPEAKGDVYKTREGILETRNDWIAGLKDFNRIMEEGKGILEGKAGPITKGAWKAFRDQVAFNGIPIQDQGRLVEQAMGELSRLADTAAIAAIHFRNHAMNLTQAADLAGAIEWVGVGFNGFPNIVSFEGTDQVTIQTAIANYLPTHQDRKHATLYMAALRFLGFENNLQRAKVSLEQAKTDGQVENIGFFERNSKSRPWGKDPNASREQQIADATKIVEQIEREAPHVVKFSDAYQNINLNYNLPWMLATNQITPEIADFLKNVPFVPLHRDIGLMDAHPLGGTGAKKSRGRMRIKDLGAKALDWRPIQQKAGSTFDRPLENFADLDAVDIVTNIQYSQLAMIRDGLTNIAANRTLNDAQQLSDAGYGVQSKQVGKEHAGDYDVLRVLKNGREEFHQMADPLMAESVMLSGFHSTNQLYKVARMFARMQRHMIVDFPAFIFNNFLKDQGQYDQISAKGRDIEAEQAGASEYNPLTTKVGGSWTPIGPLIRGLSTAGSPEALERARLAGLVTGGGGAYFDLRDLIEGGSGTLSELTESAIGRTPGQVLEAVGVDPTQYTRAASAQRRAARRERFTEIMQEKERTGKIRLENGRDLYAFLITQYQNVQQLSEATARLQAYDLALARGKGQAQAMLDGLEVMNYGRHGRSPLINVLTSINPFMSGGITGLDTWIRAHTGATDAPGAHLISRTPTEYNDQLRAHTFNRGFKMATGTLLYLMFVYGSDEYERQDETTKANRYIIPLGDKVIKLPIAFTSGMLWKAIPEMIFRQIEDERYTAGDLAEGVKGQLQDQMNFHIAPQAIRPILQAVRNHDDFRDAPIVPGFMERLDPQFQRNDYTSDTAIGLANTVGRALDTIIPGDILSSPMKMEFLLRNYFGQAASYGMLVADRGVRAATGKNVVGTRYDWTPYSLLSGQGIENFPIIGSYVDDRRQARGNTDLFYELKDEVDVYTQMVNTLAEENNPDKLRRYMQDNAGIAQYKGTILAYNRYMTRWRRTRDGLLNNPNISDTEKRNLLMKMLDERQEVLDEMVNISTGIKGAR